MAAARKTLDKARAHERVAALAWEKEKSITLHLEQQLAVAQGITIPEDDNDGRSDATLITHLHAQAASLQNIRSVVKIILEPLSPHYKRWCDLVLLTLHRYALDDHVLSDVADPPLRRHRSIHLLG
jgi:hypothetical protein